MKQYKRGIFIGKFYPFHLGHLASLEKLSNVCEKTYLIFYTSQVSELKIANQLDYEYRVNLRVADARDVVAKYENIIVIRLNISNDIVFPRDTPKIQTLVEEAIGGKADLQIFGEEEEDVYAPHVYANEYILGPMYNVKDKDGENVPLHATLIRNDYDFYRKHLPPAVRSTLDKIVHIPPKQV